MIDKAPELARRTDTAEKWILSSELVCPLGDLEPKVVVVGGLGGHLPHENMQSLRRCAILPEVFGRRLSARFQHQPLALIGFDEPTPGLNSRRGGNDRHDRWCRLAAYKMSSTSEWGSRGGLFPLTHPQSPEARAPRPFRPRALEGPLEPLPSTTPNHALGSAPTDNADDLRGRPFAASRERNPRRFGPIRRCESRASPFQRFASSELWAGRQALDLSREGPKAQRRDVGTGLSTLWLRAFVPSL